MKTKTVAESITTQVQLIMSADINGYGRLFGGRLMEWIDVVAGVVARRHSNKTVTTICVDNLNFKSAVHIDNIIVLVGKVTYVGKTSMEVKVDTFLEEVDGTRRLVNEAYLVMVALDENEKPTAVPNLVISNPEERSEWLAGQKRSELRKTRRKEEY